MEKSKSDGQGLEKYTFYQYHAHFCIPVLSILFATSD